MLSDNEKNGIRNALVEAYAHGDIAEQELETRLTLLEGCRTDEQALELRQFARRFSLPDVPALRDEVQEVVGSHCSTRKTGTWFFARRIRVVQTASALRLDLRELERFPNTTVELELELSSTSCRILLPKGTEVVDRLEVRSGVVRVRCGGENVHRLRVILTGTVQSTSLRLKGKRR